MNTCLKCGEPTDGAGLCSVCYAKRAHHLHGIINPQRRNRSKRLRAIVLTAFLLSLLFAALLYGSLHAADLQMQIMVSGKPAANAEYTLDWGGVSVPRALLHGTTDGDGMIKESDIQTGTMTLSVACLVEDVYVGEVSGQVLQQADASCRLWVPVVSK